MKSARARKAAGISIKFLAAGALIALGVLVAVLVDKPEVPAAIDTGTGATTVPVTKQDFIDSRTVTITFEADAPEALSSPVGGRVTHLGACQQGAEVSSGSVLLEINGDPLVALHTATPLWRDLSIGMEGDDIWAVQDELARLGHDIQPDGRYGQRTHMLVREVLARAGITVRPWESVPLAVIVWWPAPTVTVASCPVALGQDVTVGEPLVTLPPTLTRISLETAPAGAVNGLRMLDFGQLQVPTDDRHEVTDPQVLAEVEQSDAYQTVLGQDDPSTAEVDWYLAEPIQAIAVPPRAIYDLRDGAGCVAFGGTAYQVQVISSSLGNTLVTFDGQVDTPPQVDLNPDTGPCT